MVGLETDGPLLDALNDLVAGWPGVFGLAEVVVGTADAVAIDPCGGEAVFAIIR